MFHGTIIEELTCHEEWSHYNENIIQDQKDFVFVKYNGLHLKTMENLQSCISLRVCIFSNNFITDIHPLQSCIKLIKLDLHGNQIKSLPNTKFWSGLKNLKLLYLHDNGFAKLRNVCVLASCPKLTALTMFDCPVSLKKGYRHVLVNSIWPLKALDHHVISDEEIIQNWHLPERFKAFNQRLFFNFCPALKKGTNFEDELNSIKYIISRINVILAHNSPVLIVQRWIRGFLVRKKLSPIFLHKKYQERIRHYEKKWVYITKGYEDNFFKDIFFKPETNIKGKLSRFKHSIHSSVDLHISSDLRKYAFSTIYELKTKDIDRKSSHLQKDQKKSGEGIKEELDTSFRISAFKLPLHPSSSSMYAAALKEKRQDSLPVYTCPFSTTRPKPIIKKRTLLERNIRREFFTTQRAGMKLQTFNDIDKFYTDLKNQEQHKEKVTAVARAQAAKGLISLAANENTNKKKYMAKKLIERHNEAVQKALHQLWQEKYDYIEKIRKRRILFLEEKIKKATDHLLIQNLNNERNLLTKGMIKIDRVKKKEALLKQKQLIVHQKLQEETYKKNLIKEIKECRAQEIHKKHCEEKFVLDLLAFQKACDRYQEVKTRAAIMKTSVYKIPKEMTK